MKILGQRERFGSHLGLERIELICVALGNPQNDLKIIHVAGTNGKGSVSAFLSSVLTASGFKVGLFTSPHLINYCERFRINGECAHEEIINKLVAEAEEVIQSVEEKYPHLGRVTEFELATAVAFLYFRQAGVDLVVLETGLGGRLDSTNVVVPIMSIITTIDFDHVDRLGSTITKIAKEKGGIIKESIPVISGVQSQEAEEVLHKIALEKKAPWFSTKDVEWIANGWDLSGGQLQFPLWGTLQIGLLGQHQLENAATALLALKELTALGLSISHDAIRRGMRNVNWPGRLDVVNRDPLILMDGSHNYQGINALAQSLVHIQKSHNLGKFTFLFGMLKEKNVDLIDPLLPLADRFVFTAADSGRLPPMQPEILRDYVEHKGGEATAYADVGQALIDARKSSLLCICGSLYLVGAVKRIFHT